MKKKGYYEYDPVIYPRKLWVHIGDNLKQVLSSEFDGNDAECGEYLGVTYPRVQRKSDRQYGVLVSFGCKSDMRMNTVSHEASHACDSIEKDIGMEHGGEASAYLLGWIASCINKARLGKGNFIEAADKEKHYECKDK